MTYQRTVAFTFLSFLLIGVAIAIPATGKSHKHDSNKTKSVKEDRSIGRAVIWEMPKNITRSDLFYGPGGKQHVPHGPFTFTKEDLDGTSPKFNVEDGNGVKWKVKLGVEARPETAATRIVWAAGFLTSEDYFLPMIQVKGVPSALHRGQA